MARKFIAKRGTPGELVPCKQATSPRWKDQTLPESWDSFARAWISNQLSVYGRRPLSNCHRLASGYARKNNIPQLSYCLTCSCSCDRSRVSSDSVVAMTIWPKVIALNGNALSRTPGSSSAETATSTTPPTTRALAPNRKAGATTHSPTAVHGAAHK